MASIPISMTNDEPLRNSDLIAFHEATGCPVMTAKAALSAMEPLLRSRVLRATQDQSGQSRLHDPIEDEPALCERIRAAKEEAEIVAGPTSRRSQCHQVWFEQERILAEQGITWFSPAVMNPWMFFD
ncbi:hypothetical protein HD842_000765 [Massilia aurea]|uniref:Uncharacterized protein n=2 Tax=Massilia aurea TaxID=373040 RepID=A0A7W9U8I9_9BURK|nr:hypothetical protein [Massilia aurea]